MNCLNVAVSNLTPSERLAEIRQLPIKAVVTYAALGGAYAGLAGWFAVGSPAAAAAARGVWHALTPGWSAAGRIGLTLLVASVGVAGVVLVMRPFAVVRRAVRRSRSWPLWVSVAAAIIVGLVLVLAGYAIITRVLHPEGGSPPTEIDILRTALTAVAGIGGAVALVVAYRRQRDLEQGRFIERFGAAAHQLGDPDPAVRIAGVYAIASAADESMTFGRRQQCVDVLCGYLRLPYEPHRGASHHTEIVTTHRPPETAVLQTGRETVVHQKVRQNDREVRKTIVRVIRARLQPTAEVSWSRHDFDFTGVQFEDANFSHAVFAGQFTSFGETTFAGQGTHFFGTRFDGPHTWFDKATFTTLETSFQTATFRGETTFEGGTFDCDSTSFESAMFKGKETRFSNVIFGGHTTFDDAWFGGNELSFDDVTFGRQGVSFRHAAFHCKNSSFLASTGWQNVVVDWASDPSEMPDCVIPRYWPPVDEPDPA